MTAEMAQEMDPPAGPLADARRALGRAIDDVYAAHGVAEMDPPAPGAHPVQMGRVRDNLATALRFLDWAERDLAGRGTTRPHRPGVARVLAALGQGK